MLGARFWLCEARGCHCGLPSIRTLCQRSRFPGEQAERSPKQRARRARVRRLLFRAGSRTTRLSSCAHYRSSSAARRTRKRPRSSIRFPAPHSPNFRNSRPRAPGILGQSAVLLVSLRSVLIAANAKCPLVCVLVFERFGSKKSLKDPVYLLVVP